MGLLPLNTVDTYRPTCLDTPLGDCSRRHGLVHIHGTTRHTVRHGKAIGLSILWGAYDRWSLYMSCLCSRQFTRSGAEASDRPESVHRLRRMVLTHVVEA